MLRKSSIMLVCGLAVLLISLTGLVHAAPTESPANYQMPGMPPPLPRGSGRWGLPIGYEDSVCCVSGYVFWNGQPVAGAAVTIHNSSGQNITVQTDQILSPGDTSNSGQQYPYFKAQLDSNAFHVQPGETVTLTAAYAGSTKTIQYVAQIGGQPVDIVIPDPNLAFDCSSAYQTDLPQSECNALVAIYKSLNGPYWLNHNGWLSTNTPCSWFGVGCDNGHVTVVDLDTNQLVGTLPPEIGDIPYVSKIDLPFNRLTGMIPVTIGNLTSLYEFYLDDNQLSGPLPRELGNLHSLGVLQFPHNHLSGSIPTELGNLTNLWKLDLPFNLLSGSIPVSLSNLNGLHELYLRDNQLSGPIPLGFGQFTQLGALELANNRLTGEIPVTFSGLSSLTKLSLDHNLLSGSIPASLGQLSQLNGLFLDVNLLTGPIPQELGNLTNLQWLNLSHNLLDGTIPSSLGNLRSLRELFLDTNKLRGSIPPELGQLDQLQLLFLAVNRLDGALPSTFGNLQSLTYVNISENQLSGSIPPELGNLYNLDALYLNSNRLSGAIPWELSKLTNLSHLGLNHNYLNGAIPSQLGSLSDLYVLDLSYNQLTGSVPPELGNLTNLQELYLGRNQLSGAIPAQLGQLPNLHLLGLDNNQLSGTIPVELSQLIGLIYLNLGFNHLSGPIPAELGNLTNLEQLGLHVNQLSGPIPTQLGNLTKLRVLNLHANQLAGVIPAELRNLVNLNIGWLTLGYNKLVALDPALIDFIISRSTDGLAKTQTVAPTDVQAIPRSSSEIRVIWRPIAYTDHGGYYEVSLATAPDGPYTIQGVTPDKASNSYTITNLPGLGTYYVRVRTYTPTHDNQQNELWSDYVTITAVTADTTCHQLALIHTGSGSDPVATPADNNAEGCAAGTFKPGKSLNVCAVPASGWYMAAWNGTADDASIAPCNSLVMPNSDHIVQVAYSQTAPATPTPTPVPTDQHGAPQTSLVHLVYVAGDNELDPYLGNFVEGMLRRMTQVGARQNVTTVILYDGEQPGDTARYIFPATGARDMRTESWGEVQTDDPATLRHFILGSIEEFPADYYALSIVDHANGALGIGYDYGNASTGDHYLTTSQLRVTLEQVTYLLDRKIDVLHFDGCSFGLFEDASIAQGVANYVVASPNTGWGIFAYDKYRELAGNSTNDPRTFAQNIAQSYASSLGQKKLPYTISVFDMTNYDDLRLAISDLGDQLDAHVRGTPQASVEVQAIREHVQKYDSGDALITQNDYYVDLHDLVLGLQKTNDPPLTLAANRVSALTMPGTLGAFVLYQSSESGDYYDGASQQMRQVDLAGAYGLGIYFPTSKTSAGQLLNHYTNDETFPDLTPGWGWTRFLRSYLLEQGSSLQQNAIQASAAPPEDRLIAPLIPPTEPLSPTPSAPSGLSAVTALQTQINLIWADASNNEDGFKIERSLDGATGWIQIDTVGANVTTYSNPSLTCGTTYYYRVRAYNASGDSAYSNVANAQTVICPPTPPSSLAATPASQTQINLIWADASNNEDGFKIERSPDGVTGWTQIATAAVNVTNYANTGLTCATTYYYRVRAHNIGGDSAYSNVANAQTVICPPTPPSSLAATPASQTQINLIWADASNNEDGFKIERSLDGVTGWTQIATVGANVATYSNTGLTCGTTYYYRVRAYNTSGDSPYSNVANVPTAACVSDAIFTDDFEAGNLLLWTVCPNSAGLSVTSAATLHGTKGLQGVITSNTAMCLTDERPNAETRYRVRFYFDPNTIKMKSGDAHYIFYGYSGTSTIVLRVEFGFSNGVYQLRAGLVNDSTSWSTSSWVTIIDAPHVVEFDWKASTTTSAKNGYLTFWIDGVQKANLTGIDNDTRRIDRIQLGAISGIDTGTRGTYYFDAFESRRQTYIGPTLSAASLPLTPDTPHMLVYLPVVQQNTAGMMTIPEVSKPNALSDLLIHSIFLPEIQR